MFFIKGSIMSYENHRYYIFDCNNNVAGNLKGYRTFKGATQQASSPKSKLNKYLWFMFYSAKEHGFLQSNTVYTIDFKGINNV
jgi:hypothetical protein